MITQFILYYNKGRVFSEDDLSTDNFHIPHFKVSCNLEAQSVLSHMEFEEASLQDMRPQSTLSICVTSPVWL